MLRGSAWCLRAGLLSALIPLGGCCLTTHRVGFDRQLFSRASYADAISLVKTPDEAQKYVDNYLKRKSDDENYGVKNYVASFREIHENGGHDCEGAAMAAAALLSDEGYPPLMMVLHANMKDLSSKVAHAVFIYQAGGKWGAIGFGSDAKRPIYRSIDVLASTYEYRRHFVVDLNELKEDWVDGQGHLSGIEVIINKMVLAGNR